MSEHTEFKPDDTDYNYHSEPLTKEDIEQLTYDKRREEADQRDESVGN